MVDMNMGVVAGIGVFQFVLGALWYSPLLFGRSWARIMKMDHVSKEEMQKMQKEMAPAYAAQFLVSLLNAYVLMMVIRTMIMADIGFHAYGAAGWIWLGITFPMVVGSVMWSQTAKKDWLTQMAIMGGYQLVCAMVAAWMISTFV